MKRAISFVMVMVLSACASSAKERPPPAEEAFVLSAAAPSSSAAEGSAASSSASSGTVPDMSGVVVGARADSSPPLQGLSPSFSNGKLTTYNPEAPKPFFGFPLIAKSFVSVDNGKITDVTNGIDPAKCSSLRDKLTSAYGPRKGANWSAGPAEIQVTGSNKTTCSIMILLAR